MVTSYPALCRLTRKLVVALANRTTRVVRRSHYVSRIPKIERECRLRAPAVSASFGGLLFKDGVHLARCVEVGAVAAADKVLDGSFVLFGEWFEVPEAARDEDVRWRTDFQSGYRFPVRLYTDIGAVNGVADIKVPWEYGRLQFLLPLAIAYRAKRSRRYLDAYRSLVLGFRLANPLGSGVQWVCTMEVGIRVFNLLASYEVLSDTIDGEDDLHCIVAELALAHAEHIWANLETSARLQENNHYIADLLGLAAVASCFPTYAKSLKWGQYARDELLRCSRKQILEDGCCFERSTRYTRLVGEMLFCAGRSLSQTAFSLPPEYFEKLATLGEFLESVTDDAGRSLQVGDNDSGRAIVISPRSHDDLRLVGRLVAREAGRMSPEVPALFLEEALLYGTSDLVDSIFSSRKAAVEHFKDAGFAVVRKGGWTLGFFACDGFEEDAEPGHTHNDKLSVTLDVDGEPFFVDPGSGVYTRDTSQRDKLRGTSHHSTLHFAELEQNEFHGLFGYTRCGGASLHVAEDGSRISLRGVTDCWADRLGLNHEREVVVEDSEIRIKDFLSGTGREHAACRSFILAPSVRVEEIDCGRALLRSGGVSVLLETNGCMSVRKGLYSPRYGSVSETLILDAPFRYGEINVVRIARARDAI